jgi:hypothetical protein
MIYGLNLPDDVLQKVYYRNAEKLLAQFKTSKQAARSVSVVAPATKAAR